jgi:hypothetical protein
MPQRRWAVNRLARQVACLRRMTLWLQKRSTGQSENVAAWS